MSKASRWLFRTTILLALALMGSCAPQQAADSGVKVFGTQDIPDTLSAWQLFKHQNNKLTLSERVTPYQLNSSLFTDYAHKLRTVWLPENGTASYSDDDTFGFPVGSVISKTFYYPKHSSGVLHAVNKQADNGQYFANNGLPLGDLQLIETRLLVHQGDGWQAISYVWNDDQTEAYREIAGDMKMLSLHDGSSATEFAYIVPDQNQCAGCHVTNHSSKKLWPIGPKARHLNKNAQLEQWQSLGLLAELPEAVPANADWRDTQVPIEQRARAYMDINCGHCHNAQGAADTSALLLDISNSNKLKLGFCKPPVAAGRGTGNRRYSIVPGDAHASIMTYRLQSTRPGDMMPELGRTLAHEEGVELLSRWINQLDGEC